MFMGYFVYFSVIVFNVILYFYFIFLFYVLNLYCYYILVFEGDDFFLIKLEKKKILNSYEILY